MKTLKTIVFFICLVIALANQSVYSQKLTQTLRGSLVDEDNKSPLIGASVLLTNDGLSKGTTTNERGEFRFDNIPVGRVNLQVSYLGYLTKSFPNILVSSGKEVILKLEMKESLQNLQEVVVTSQKKKGEAKNEMAIISSRGISVDEAKRYAGSVQDPSRMVSSYAGVTSDPQGDNDIVVRGNSPKGILWKLEGIEIPNPNHFANEGATGGPINALNNELLANSDFYTGAFAPEYGDALSGVFDMRLRAGNNEKREYSLGVGVLGTDLAVEGPFKKGYTGSYLANYRYSSLSMLDQMGLVHFDGVPKYQDGAFKVVLPSKKMGTLSVFGLGGISHIYVTENESKESKRIVEKVDYGAQLGVLGLIHTLPLSQNTFLKLSMAAANNGSTYKEEKVNTLEEFNLTGNGKWEKNSLRTTLMLNSKLSAKDRITTGVNYAYYFYNLYEKYFNDEHNQWETPLDKKANAGMLQGYFSWKHRFNDYFTIVGGLHSTYFSLGKNFLVEPRLALNWQITPNQSINLGYGMHSKAESGISYYTVVTKANGETSMPNRNLGLSKAQHFVLGYEFRISENLNSKLDIYYQNLYNIPVENVDTSNFSMLNMKEGYVSENLVNEGKGYNYGVEYTLERFFNKGFYFLITASLYDSKYKAKDGVWRNTKFNGNYAFNFLTGKEFKVGKTKVNTLAINTKFFFNGGRRYVPVDLAASMAKNMTEYDRSRAWNKKLDDIYQINFSVSYRINRPKTSHEFIIDIMNLTDAQGRTDENYNKYTKEIVYDHQLNMLPNIMYRLHF